jgi:hypothetical protein
MTRRPSGAVGESGVRSTHRCPASLVIALRTSAAAVFCVNAGASERLSLGGRHQPRVAEIKLAWQTLTEG